MYIKDMGQRKCDSQGCGHYKASRGSRTHQGVDLCASDNSHLPINTSVQSGIYGKVVKVGWAYSDPDKSHLRYIAVKFGEYYFRLFYVQPLVKVGDKVSPDTVIGRSLCLGEFYNGITEHCHFEVYTLKDESKGEHSKSNFEYVDPDIVLNIMRNV